MTLPKGHRAFRHDGNVQGPVLDHLIESLAQLGEGDLLGVGEELLVEEDLAFVDLTDVVENNLEHGVVLQRQLLAFGLSELVVEGDHVQGAFASIEEGRPRVDVVLGGSLQFEARQHGDESLVGNVGEFEDGFLCEYFVETGTSHLDHVHLHSAAVLGLLEVRGGELRHNGHGRVILEQAELYGEGDRQALGGVVEGNLEGGFVVFGPVDPIDGERVRVQGLQVERRIVLDIFHELQQQL